MNAVSENETKSLVLRHHLSPGDVLMLTATVRDLHRHYPGQFLTDVRTSAHELWENNPYITQLNDADPRNRIIDCHYPLINRSNTAPFHFIHGFHKYLSELLGLPIEPTEFRADIHLSADERMWISQVHELVGSDVPFWIINAGGKYDFTTKWWSKHNYQAVVDHFAGRITFVQIGQLRDYHPTLNGVLDLRGRTTIRQLVRLMYHSIGVICPVTFVMHLAAAVTCKPPYTHRPCIVVAGGREPPHWEAYPGHQYLHTIGMLRCCDGFACWKSRIRQIGDFDSKDAERSLCTNTVDLQPRCQQLITPQQVIELVERYHSAHLIVASGPTVTVGPEVLSLASEGRQCSESEKQRMAITLFDPITEDTAALVADRYLEVAMPRYPETSSGRGIVIVGGGIKYYPSAWVCINMLRKNGCTLPIELWHLGSAEMTLEMEALLRPLGVTCIDTNKVREKYHCKPLGGWETKAYALMFCSFESVLLLDADNVPLVNPEYLFETKEFIENGAVFWPDYGRLGADRKIWRICDVEYRDEPEFESGQILVNKRVCWKSLSLAMWYNLHSEFFYQYVHGDKETFHLAFRKTKKAYSMPNYGIHPLYATMCQHDFEGNRIFQHRNLAKWNLYQNLRIQGFEAEDECLRFIDALRTMWSGKIFCGQFDFSTAKSAVFADALEVVATRWCYERVGYDKRLIRLQLNGLVGVGADRCESAWGMEVNGKCIELLLFCVDGTVTCRFVKDSMGVWSGRWINHEQMEVRLLAAGDLCEPFAI